MNIFPKWPRSNPARIAVEVLFASMLMFAVYHVNAVLSRSLEKSFDHPFQALLPLVYPAVFFAAGQGLGTTDVEGVPGLSQFIYGETDSFDTANIPDDVELVPVTSPLIISHLYYLYAVGWIWKLFGVSLDALLLFSMLLRALCAGVLYLLSRLFLGRLGSVVCVLLVCISPAMLHTGMSLRDFSKVPFFLSAFVIMAFLATRPVSRYVLLLLSAGLGTIMGIGMGFRQDILICLVPVLITLLFFTRTNTRRPWRLRACGLGVFLACFLVSGYPIFRGTSLEGNQTIMHSLLLGVSTGMESKLGFGGASYEVVPEAFAGDSVNLAAVNVYARRSGNRDSMVNVNSAEYLRYEGDKNVHLFIDPYLLFNGKMYSRFAGVLMLDLFRMFPADFVARAWCAVAAMFEMPARVHAGVIESVGAGLPRWLDAVMAFQGAFVRHLARWGLFYTGAVLIVLSAVNFTRALYFTGMLLWFAGYTSILYEYRHNFYLVFIPVLAVAIVVEWTVQRLKNLARRKGVRQVSLRELDAARWKPLLGRSSCFVVLILALIVIPLTALRFWQVRQVNEFAGRLRGSEMEPVTVVDKGGGGMVSIEPKEVLPQLAGSQGLPPGETAWEYLALVFDTHGRDIPVTIHYDKSRMLNDFSQTVVVEGVDDGGPGRTTFFFPVYEAGTSVNIGLWQDFLRTYPVFKDKIQDARPLAEQEWWRRGKFLGVSFSKEYQGLFAGMFRVARCDDIPILPLIQVPAERKVLRPFKTGPLERILRDCVTARCKREYSPSLPPVANDPWNLDEPLLFHPPSGIFARPLLDHETPEAYRAEWQSRIDHYPGLAEAAALDLANAGGEWMRAGRIEEAAASYRASCELDPDNALYPARLGQILIVQGLDEDAIEQFETALKLQPLLPETADRVDSMLLESGNQAGRESLWTRIFQLHPDSWFAGMRLGSLLEAAGKTAEAATVYGKVYAAHPEHPDTRLALARCLGRTGQHAEAIRLIDETVAGHADYTALAADHLASLGEYLSLNGMPEPAEVALSRALSLAPGNPGLLTKLGDVQLQNHKMEAGRASYTKALGVLGDDDPALRATLVERIKALQVKPADEETDAADGP